MLYTWLTGACLLVAVCRLWCNVVMSHMCRFLILDPHYTGREDIKTITDKVGTSLKTNLMHDHNIIHTYMYIHVCTCVYNVLFMRAISILLISRYHNASDHRVYNGHHWGTQFWPLYRGGRC